MTTPWEPEVVSYPPDEQSSRSQAVWDPDAGVFRTAQMPVVGPPTTAPPEPWVQAAPSAQAPIQPTYANGAPLARNGQSQPPQSPTAGGQPPDPRGTWDPDAGVFRSAQMPVVGPPASAPPQPWVQAAPSQPTYSNESPRGDYPASAPPLPPPPVQGGGQPYDPRGTWDPATGTFQMPVVAPSPFAPAPDPWEPSPGPYAHPQGQPSYTNGSQAAPVVSPPAHNGAVPSGPMANQPSNPQGVWDPSTGTYTSLQAATGPAIPTPPSEQWEYVDPSSYSNPYTPSPVYTSGPQLAAATAPVPVFSQPAPVSAPIPPGAIPPQGFEQQPGFAPQPTTGPEGFAGPADADPLLAANYEPEKGELKIKERRSWKTWQLLTAVLIAAVLGMLFNGNTGSASGTSAGAGGGGYKLPPPSGSTATTAAGSAGAGGGSATATTGAAGATGAGASTTTTAAGGAAASTATTAAPASVGPATVLVPQVQQAGNWTSPAFTIAGGTWNIGWAFQCTPAPSATPTFEIFVVNNGSAPGSTPAVTSSAASGSAVTPLTSAGSQQVIVQTGAACRWALKVTGSSS